MVDQLSKDAGTDQRRLYLGTALATRRDQYLALTIAAVSCAAFIAIVPFVRVPLARMPAFIPTYEGALVLIDLLTAVLLFDQAARLRSMGILILAAGYLFDAFIIVPHLLSFPGAFAPTGLLGAREQTTAWLYVFWHGGFPLFVLAYAFQRRREEGASQPMLASAGSAIAVSVVVVFVVVVALTLIATWGHDALPVVMQGSDYSLLVTKGISPAVWLLTLVAMISLWRRQPRMLDLWLMLVMWVWLFDIALAAVIGSSRFDLGFYAGRIFGLIASSFLLITLLLELAQIYTGLLGVAASAEQRPADIDRPRHSSDANERHPSRGEQTETFINRRNIARYRELLDTGSLDDEQRRSIERLLSEEEAKAKAPEGGRLTA